jgi:hypothetical protein
MTGLGRTLTVPATDAGGQQLTGTYYVDDSVRTLTQNGVTRTMLRDPAGRVRDRQTTASTNDEISHYSDDSDSPILDPDINCCAPTSTATSSPHRRWRVGGWASA